MTTASFSGGKHCSKRALIDVRVVYSHLQVESGDKGLKKHLHCTNECHVHVHVCLNPYSESAHQLHCWLDSGD